MIGENVAFPEYQDGRFVTEGADKLERFHPEGLAPDIPEIQLCD